MESENLSLSKILDHLTSHTNRFTKYYEQIKLGAFVASQKNEEYQDLISSAIVFWHSIFEDIFRQLIKYRFQNGYSSWFENPPLYKIDKSKTKFSLLELKKEYGNKTIDEIIEIALDEKLSRVTINSIEDIHNWMAKISINKDSFKNLFPKIQEGIKKRHIIVHQASRINENGDLLKIEEQDFSDFLKASSDLLFGVLKKIDD